MKYEKETKYVPQKIHGQENENLNCQCTCVKRPYTIPKVYKSNPDFFSEDTLIKQLNLKRNPVTQARDDSKEILIRNQRKTFSLKESWELNIVQDFHQHV